jgi:hypothetical protein
VFLFSSCIRPNYLPLICIVSQSGNYYFGPDGARAFADAMSVKCSVKILDLVCLCCC